MVDRELGQAVIVYDDPDGETVEKTVENEHIAYFQDHWILKTGEEDGRDLVRRIPIQRVHYVERSVEQFEREVSTLRDQVQSVADDLRSKLLGSGEETHQTDDAIRIDVSEGSDDDPDARR
ncbi:hypothetical protein [Haloarchaeobius sp. HME9146]|uniref:hypothetical protein n=1 Tax=Haloarchaeobius sp. HME9146 TaxID=2978732 RepID=UPI0021BE3ACF|nr:hypothetical protein [Haloarchaeobius sp. HME9146]MCT9097829.1 hypothetical protein [Haloarchaeobius sp. HME9146]